MAEGMPFDLTINPSTYLWTGRFMRFLRNVLKVHIKLHHDRGQIESGDIFLFNHFARFETFIPQYLFYEHGQYYCRSVADHALFRKGDRFSHFLLSIGAVPNNTPNLLAVLAAEVLRGRKIIVFPEGGMVKDRQVLDGSGQYSIYSRSAEQRRKQHSGSAVIGLALETFKRAVLRAELHGDSSRLQAWTRLLEFDSPDALIEAARKPTLIVPANITFYPMRVRGNPLERGVQSFNKGISPRLREELLIEGNILLKETDMDIRLGTPIRPASFWSERERRLVERRAARLGTLEEAFSAHALRADQRLRAAARSLQSERLRDAYMHAMYQLVTVNLSHLAALTIYQLLDAGRTTIDRIVFHRMLYLAVKKLQQRRQVNFHRSLLDPTQYEDLPDGRCKGLDQFLRTVRLLGLVEYDDHVYRFLPKLRAEHAFDQIRLENPVEVYANEIAPIRPATEAVTAAIADAPRLTEVRMAELRFDDERIAWAFDRQQFSTERHQAINALQQQIEDPEPFLFRPPNPRALGVLLVHGFLASPAEVRQFGERLSQAGFTVLGVRLKGHGTSPWDLRTRSHDDWSASVRRGFDVLAPLVERVAIVGFSTGATLALQLAARRPEVYGVAAISTPMRFKNKNMIFVPLVHKTNRLAEAIWTDGIKPFQPNDSEHPQINYLHMPIRALYELGRLVEVVKKHLAEVRCPVLIVQADEDPVVDSLSASLLEQALSGVESCETVTITAQRHGILYEDIGETRDRIERFLRTLSDRLAPRP